MYKDLLNQLKKTDFMTHMVKSFFPQACHKLISSRTIIDPELRECYQRIGYFYLPNGQPIIYTCAKISLKRTKKELIEELKQQRKPFGELLRDYYPKDKIKSQTISFLENVKLPDYFKQIVTDKLLSCHKRYILIDGEKIAIATEYI